MRLATEKKHKKYWEDRKIDWNQAYMSTWDHPIVTGKHFSE
jgi:hypothetical protein